MRLITLTLENFGRFDYAEFTFEDGLNLLVGENGAGKSTILDAIDLGLFSINIPNKEYYIRKGASSATIQLVLQIAGKILRLVRTWSLDSAGKSHLYEGDKCLASGMKNIQAYLSPYMGSKIYFDLYYLRQGRILDFLNLFESSRGAIETLFGYKLRGLDDKLVSFLEERFPFSAEKHASLSAMCKMLEEMIEAHFDKLNTVRRELAAIKIGAIMQRIGEIDNELTTAAEQVKLAQILRHVQDLTSELDAINKNLTLVASSYESLSNQYALQSKSKSELQSLIHERQEYDRLSNQLVVLQQQLHDRFRTRTRLGQCSGSASLREISVRLDLMKEVVDQSTTQCPVCLSEIDANRREYLRATLSDLELLRNTVAQRQRDRSIIKSLITQIKDIRRRLKDLFEVSDIPLDILRQLVTHLDTLGHLNSRKQFIENELSRLSVPQSITLPSEERIAELKEEKKKLNEQVIAYQAKRQIFDDLTTQLRKYEEDLEHYKLEAERSQTEAEFHEWCMTFIENVIRNIRTACRIFLEGRILPRVNETLESLGSNYVIRLDSDSTFLADVAGTLLPLSRLSYGQRVLLCLIFILNFLLETNAGNILLADEPTAGLDAQKLGSLADLLAKIHTICVNNSLQLIWATHESSFLSGVGHCIEVAK